MMKKTLSALLLLLTISGITLAPVSSVFAGDNAKSAETKDGDKKKDEKEPECD